MKGPGRARSPLVLSQNILVTEVLSRELRGQKETPFILEVHVIQG